MSKQVTTVTLKDGTERVYESYPVEDYEALRLENKRLREALKTLLDHGFWPEDDSPEVVAARNALSGAAP